MYGFFSFLVGICFFAIPIVGIMYFRQLKKPKPNKFKIPLLVCCGVFVVSTIFGIITQPDELTNPTDPIDTETSEIITDADTTTSEADTTEETTITPTETEAVTISVSETTETTEATTIGTQSPPETTTAATTTEQVTTPAPVTTAPPVTTKVLETTNPPVVTDEQPKTQSYILNTNTLKFHVEGCRHVGKIKDEHRQTYTGKRDDVIAQGYSPCGTCKP